MSPDLEKRIAAVAADRESGASEILVAVCAILRDAIAQRVDLGEVAHALRRAQPSMAPVWNAIAAARAGDLDRFMLRVARAPQAIARFAVDLFVTGVSQNAALRIVTISCSGTVARVLEALANQRTVSVACSESRPALEGRRLASRLAAAGIPVTYYSDAAIGHGLESADAVLVGADAVAGTWFLNKSGTHLLAAAAQHAGVPLYVAAGREKFLDDATARELELRFGPPEELWDASPAGISVQNPYFERIPLLLSAAIITDAGVIAAGGPLP